MINTIRSIFLTTLIFCQAYAQNEHGSISGKIQNSDGEVASFVTIILLNSDSVLVKADVTKENGTFQFIQIKEGQYKVGVRDLQYQPYFTELFSLKAGENYQLPAFTVTTAVTELEGVEVTAARPLVDVQPDKTVFNVENSINAMGNDGMELLRKAPGVVIDNNDNIILQGKNGVRIYLDGKPTQLRGEDLVAMLKSLQSDQIESIEIITNPSAKYDAEGNAGIINIKLKRDKNLGMNATITGNYSVGERDSYQSSININNRNKHTNFFGSYTRFDNTWLNDVSFYKQLNGNFLDQRSAIVGDISGHNFRAGMDYIINEQHTIGVVTNGSISNRDIGNISVTPIGNIQTGEVAEILEANNLSISGVDNINGNFNYQYKGKKGSTFNLDLDYGYYWNSGKVDQPNRYLDPSGEVVHLERNYTNDQLTQIDIKTIKGDYEISLGKGRFSTGFKYSNVITENGFDFYNIVQGEEVLDLDRSNFFNYDEKVSALYASYFSNLSEKVSINAGVRMEHTQSDGMLESIHDEEDERVERSYTDLFPSGGISYALNKTNKFSVNYSRRIDRPSYQDLNPFEFKLDELTYRKGNPFLNPQYTHSFQLIHTFKYKLNTTLSYSITEDFFAQVTDTVGNRGTILQQRNIADGTNIGLNISYPFNISKWWSAYTNLNLYRATYDANFEGVEINLDAVTFNAYIQNNFVLPKGFKMEVSGFYNSPSIWGGTFAVNSIWAMEIGFRKSVFEDRGQLKIGVSDIFKTQKWTAVGDYGGLRVDGRGASDSRRFKVGFTYQIGNKQVKAARNRKTGLEEESKRIKEGDN